MLISHAFSLSSLGLSTTRRISLRGLIVQQSRDSGLTIDSFLHIRTRRQLCSGREKLGAGQIQLSEHASWASLNLPWIVFCRMSRLPSVSKQSLIGNGFHVPSVMLALSNAWCEALRGNQGCWIPGPVSAVLASCSPFVSGLGTSAACVTGSPVA